LILGKIRRRLRLDLVHTTILPDLPRPAVEIFRQFSKL